MLSCWDWIQSNEVFLQNSLPALKRNIWFFSRIRTTIHLIWEQLTEFPWDLSMESTLTLHSFQLWTHNTAEESLFFIFLLAISKICILQTCFMNHQQFKTILVSQEHSSMILFAFNMTNWPDPSTRALLPSHLGLAPHYVEHIWCIYQ